MKERIKDLFFGSYSCEITGQEGKTGGRDYDLPFHAITSSTLLLCLTIDMVFIHPFSLHFFNIFSEDFNHLATFPLPYHSFSLYFCLSGVYCTFLLSLFDLPLIPSSTLSSPLNHIHMLIISLIQFHHIYEEILWQVIYVCLINNGTDASSSLFSSSHRDCF